MPAGESFDVVIVGARCAGAPLAALLAGRGRKVAVVEQATFPRNTLSSHLMQADALAFLDRLGVTPRVRATGAPFITSTAGRFENVHFSADYPLRDGDVGGAASIRRHLLDPILADAAAEAGADVRMATRVVGLVEDGGRVAGVRAVGPDGVERELRGTLVVGADGRGSTVAAAVGARAYNVTPSQREYYWAYFEGAAMPAKPTFVFHRWGDRFVLGAPADSGLYMIGVSPEAGETATFRADLEGSVMDHALSCAPVAAAVGAARRVDKIYGIRRFTGYFRDAAGPGWVLLGDAGHFKDPAAGRGIGDAFLQVDALAAAIGDALDGPPAALDAATARWGRWRDRTFADHYWLGADIGKAGAIPRLLPELLRRLVAAGRVEEFLDLLSHRNRPSEVLTVPRVLGATASLLRTGGDRLALLREVRTLLGDDLRHRRMNRRPVYGADTPPEVPGEPAPTLATEPN